MDTPSKTESDEAPTTTTQQSQSPMPPFRFGQFGQAPMPSDWSLNSSSTTVQSQTQSQSQSQPQSLVESASVTKSISSGFDTFLESSPAQAATSTQSSDQSNSSIDANDDEDSFLAEPSISAVQFDNTVFPTQSQSQSQSSTSSLSVPILLEEPEPVPVYLEEPASHSLEDVQKANVLNESWENVDIGEIEAAESEMKNYESAQSQELNIDDDLLSQSENNLNTQTTTTTHPHHQQFSQQHLPFGSQPLTQDFNFDLEKTDETVPEPEIETLPETSAMIIKEVQVKEDDDTEKNVKVAPVKKARVVAEKKQKVVHTGTTADESSSSVGTRHSTRERVPISRLSESVVPAATHHRDSLKIPTGSGTRLGDIPHINNLITKKPTSDKSVILLHRIIFDRPGEARQRRSNLRSFCGTAESGQETLAALEGKLLKHTVSELKQLVVILGISGGLEKVGLANNIATFLLNPSPSLSSSDSVSKASTVKGKKSVAKKKTKTPSTKRSASTKSTSTSAKRVKTSSSSGTAALTPETVDSDIDSDIEREVLDEIKSTPE